MDKGTCPKGYFCYDNGSCKGTFDKLFTYSSIKMVFEILRNQNGCINSKAIFTDPCENTTCVEGEVCEEGICKCNMSSTCGGNDTVNYCDFKSSKCKCAENVDACSEGQKCIEKECKGI